MSHPMSRSISQSMSPASSGKKSAAARLHLIGTVPGETTYAARNEDVYIAGYFAQILMPERKVRP